MLPRLSFCFFFMFWSFMTIGQVFNVYALTDAKGQGPLLREETYENNQLISLTRFDRDGQPNYTIQKKYNDQGWLTKQIQTFHEEYEYDLIKQYTYDEKGNKTGELFGNNRTGKWGSYRYHYNPYGAIDTVYIYQKNGDLTNLRIFDFTYDAQGEVIVEKRWNKSLVTDSLIPEGSIYYEYPGANRIKITIRNAEGEIVFIEDKQLTTSGLPKQITTTTPGYATIKEVHFYDSTRQKIKTIEYVGSKLSKTTTYRYNESGIRVEQCYLYPDGTYGGTLYKMK